MLLSTFVNYLPTYQPRYIACDRIITLKCTYLLDENQNAGTEVTSDL